MSTKIPVTVITGFLGSGKTTLIRHLLQNNQGRKIAVVVNEFGEIGIDGELLRSCQVCDEENEVVSNIIELNNGCLCCTVQEEFFPTMQELLKRRDSIDCIVIETSGLALPQPLIQAFRWQEIRTIATVDGVITVVDCAAVAAGTFASDINAVQAQRQADPNLEHETPLEELFEDQLACADLVLLTKVDLVDRETREKVETWLQQELRPGVKIIHCHGGEIAPEILLGFNAAVEENLDQRSGHHDLGEEHDHDDDINSLYITLPPQLEIQELVNKLETLVQEQEIYRIKGFVNIANKPMRMVFQGVGNRFDYFFDRPWQATESRETQLVFIGKDLDSQIINQSLLLN